MNTKQQSHRMQNCPYCGFEFDGTADYCTGSCPLAKNCSMIMCPNCRYEFVLAESKTLNFFKKLFSRSTNEVSLAEESGEHVTTVTH